MEAEARVIVECPHCGEMYDVGRSEIENQQGVRCGRCRRTFTFGRDSRGAGRTVGSDGEADKS